MIKRDQASGISECGEQSVKAAGFTFNLRTSCISGVTGDLSGMLGYPLEELASSPLSRIWPDEAERDRFLRLLNEQQVIPDYCTALAHRSGSLLPVTIAASALPGTDVICIVSSHPPEEGEYLQIFNSLMDGILILDWNGTTLFANTAVATLVGASSPAELIGKSPLQFIHPDYAAAIARDLENVRSGHDGYLAHYLMRDLHGNDRWVEGLGTTILFKGREVSLVAFRDITERKSVEGELARTNQKSRDLYRLVRMMCDNVPDLIWAKDTEGRYLFANRAVCEKLLNAVDTDEPPGKTDMFFIERERQAHPEDPEWYTIGEICQDSDALVMESGEARRFDEFGNIQGKFFHFDINKAPFRDEAGRMIGTVGCGRDVTEERQVEERLRWNEALLSRMAQSSPLACLVVDNQTDDIHYFNNRFCRMWGLSHLEDRMWAGEIRNSDIIHLCTLLVRDPETFTAFSAPIQDEANRLIIEDEFEFTDGRHIRWFSTQIRDVDDRYLGRLYLFEDITERKRASRALCRHDAIMSAVNFAADRFLKEPDWKRQMQEVLERFGRATGVSAVCIFENGTNSATGNLVCNQRWGWRAEGVDTRADSTEPWTVSFDAIPRWHGELAAGNPVFGRVQDFPEPEQTYLSSLCLQSIAVVPIFVHREWWGSIGFSETRGERFWSSAEIEALRAAASIIGSAILRTMNEEVYRNPVERSPVGVYLMQDRYVRYFNTRFAEIFGYSRDELRGYNAQFSLIAPECREDLQKRYLAVLSGETASEHHEFCGVHKDGEIIYLENFTTRILFEGRPAIIGSLMDVTDRKRADEALRNSEKRLKIFFEYAPDAFFLADADGVIVDGNRAAEKMLGCMRAEFIGRKFAEITRLEPDQRPKIVAMLDQIVNNNATGPIGLVPVRSDGTRIPVEMTAFPVIIDDRQLVLAIGRDISERQQLEDLKKRALLQIEENIERLAILNDSIRNPLTVIIALAEMGDTEIDRKISKEAWAINETINQLDRGWLVSRKVKEFLKKHYS